MGFAEGGNKIIKFIYDPLVGRFTREVKSRDIFRIAGATIATDSAFAGLASGSVAASKEILITNMFFSSDDCARRFNVTAGTSTLFQPSVMSGSYPGLLLNTTVDAPFAIVSGTTMVTVDVAAGVGSSTVACFICGVVHPKPDHLETK